MRTTQIPCSRCGSTHLGGHSVLEIEAGDLAMRHDEPCVDLCASCVDGFEEFLESACRPPPTDAGSALGGQSGISVPVG
jgi:hypothetical protein